MQRAGADLPRVPPRPHGERSSHTHPADAHEMPVRVVVFEILAQAILLEVVAPDPRSEEHTSELQSRLHLVCRLLLEKKKKIKKNNEHRQNHRNTTLSRVKRCMSYT